MRIRSIHQLFAAILPALLTACGADPGPGQARVFFTGPADGASVSSPVHVSLSAEHFTVEPAGEVKAGAGHLHIMVDAECLKPGEAIPRDEAHLHYGDGQLEADLELTPGTHSLCLQAADGAHIALDGEGMTHAITITVE